MARSKIKSKVTVKATLTKQNVNSATSLIDFCRELGVRIVFGYVQILGRAAENFEYALSSDEITNFNIFLVDNYPEIALPLMFSHTPCPLDIEEEPLSFRIAANGDIFPCASFHEQFFCIGNIFSTTLKEAIHDVILKQRKFKSMTISIDSFNSQWNQLRSPKILCTKNDISRLVKSRLVDDIYIQVILSRFNSVVENIVDILEFCRFNSIGIKFKLMDDYKYNNTLQYLLSS